MPRDARDVREFQGMSPVVMPFRAGIEGPKRPADFDPARARSKCGHVIATSEEDGQSRDLPRFFVTDL
jgi:hypothetical protein